MGAAKWIGGFLGFITAGPLGALAGFILGSLFETGLDAVNGPEEYNNRCSHCLPILSEPTGR